MIKIDLHIHSNISDGALTPKEIATEAIKNGLRYFSISDHDTIGAYNAEFFEFLKDKNITLIPAVEISTKFNGTGVHILGYNFDVNNEKLRKKLYEARNVRHIYLTQVAEKLKELGYKVNVDKLDKIDAVTKAHIFDDIATNPKNKDLLIQTFGHIPNEGEFIENIMNEGCPAYVEKKSISPAEAAEVIRGAGGKVVLAHPVAYAHEDGLTEKDVEEIVKSMNPDGLETYYIYVDSLGEKFDETKKWSDFAKKHGLFTTVGSDFHNDDGLRPLIGFTNEKLELSEEQINEIVKNLTKKI